MFIMAVIDTEIVPPKYDRDAYTMKGKSPVQMYDRLLKLASGALAEVCFITFNYILTHLSLLNLVIGCIFFLT